MARVESRTGGRDATTAIIPGRHALSVGSPDLPIPTGWRWQALSSVARLESGHTPSRRHPEYWGGDIPWIRIQDATANHGHVIHDTVEHTNQLGIENSSARVLPADTVCLSRTASVGYVTVMGRPIPIPTLTGLPYSTKDTALYRIGPVLLWHRTSTTLIVSDQAQDMRMISISASRVQLVIHHLGSVYSKGTLQRVGSGIKTITNHTLWIVPPDSDGVDGNR